MNEWNVGTSIEQKSEGGYKSPESLHYTPQTCHIDINIDTLIWTCTANMNEWNVGTSIEQKSEGGYKGPQSLHCTLHNFQSIAYTVMFLRQADTSLRPFTTLIQYSRQIVPTGPTNQPPTTRLLPSPTQHQRLHKTPQQPV